MKTPIRIAAWIFVLLGLTACSLSGILNATITTSGYQIHRDIAYGDNPRQVLDIYTPEGLTAPAAVIVFFYGGSWQFGKKSDYLFLGQAFASRGFLTVIADYRLYPEIHFPAFVQDGAAAFRFTHEHIKQYGGDPNKMFLAGHSAGAYMMLTVDDQYLKEAHANKSWIRGTIGIAGPYDFLPLTDPKIIDIFSKTDLALTQPINFIQTKQPPIFLAQGFADDTVGIKNTRNVSQKLEVLHSPVETHYYEDVGHIGIILSLAQHFREKTPLLDQITDFIKHILNQP